MKKKIVIFSAFLLTLILGWTLKANKKMLAVEKSEKPAEVKEEKRAPSSLKKEQSKVEKPKEVIKYAKVLKNAQTIFANMVKDNQQVEIIPIKETIFKLGTIETPALKVRVSIKGKGGYQSNFNALLNKENGKLIRSWNSTFVEIKRQRTVLNIEGREL